MEAARYPKVRIHRQLDLDAPLMSTRRSWSSFDTSDVAKNSDSITMRLTSTDASSRIPFSWESSPGVPKGGGRTQHCSNYNNSHGALTPRPPPVRRGPLRADCSVADDHRSDKSSDHGSFMDALDRMSLSETPGIGCREVARQSPSFIMDRFLPAAHAIASSSVVGNAKHSTPPAPPNARRRTPRRTDTKLQMEFAHHGERPSTMACGLVLFFPWSLKPAVCGFDSPLCIRTPRTIIKDVSRELYSSEKYDGKKRSRRSQTPGWGLSFLDYSRCRARGRESGRRNIANAHRVSGEVEGRRERNQDRRDDKVCSPPQLKPPSDPWLLRALNSQNRRS
ncbi:uncharacterized protein [Typha angustifolia]|uniref:uncharacterized protein n=1 Tax=Typha angustifolia TaxID=59011 RepID=UPI003C2AE94C